MQARLRRLGQEVNDPGFEDQSRAYMIAVGLLWMLVYTPFYILLALFSLHRRWATRPLRCLTSGQELALRRGWFSVTRLRGRRGLVLHVGFDARRLRSQRLDVEFRLRLPSGDYVRAALQRYRGEAGELRLRHRTAPVQNDPATFQDLWGFVPMRALALPPGTERIELVGEALVSAGRLGCLLTSFPVELDALPEDFPVPLPAERPEEDGGVELIEGSADEGEGADCQVCGAPIEGDGIPCPACETPHHRECWEYMGRCSTFGCEGRPADIAPDGD